VFVGYARTAAAVIRARAPATEVAAGFVVAFAVFAVWVVVGYEPRAAVGIRVRAPGVEAAVGSAAGIGIAAAALACERPEVAAIRAVARAVQVVSDLPAAPRAVAVIPARAPVTEAVAGSAVGCRAALV
jgi:hypothetical protein